MTVDRIALVHDFLVQDGGAERSLLELSRLLPGARIHTSFYDAGRFGDRFPPDTVRAWPLGRIPGAASRFRAFLPLYPAWFSALDLRDHDLVVSSSSAFAHGVRASPHALHVACIYTPMRFAWDLDGYLRGSSLPITARLAGRLARPVLRRWDVRAARRPDVLVAISAAVRERIERLWRRPSELIHPPVDAAAIPLSTSDDGFLLVAARMLAYRRLDLAVAAATRLGRELVVVGDGPERARLEGLAGPSVRFLGHLERDALLDLFARCHAYLVPGMEDFGIAPVEAMAAGKPVVAFRAGGALETVVEGATGVFFDRPDAPALADAIESLEGMAWDPAAIRAHALRFDTAIFHERWRALLARNGVDPRLWGAGAST
jgi:glycosyltransferase involved in cell wall biosynthesis